ncbi:glutathione S-transferase family protein [Oceanococcus atlanticus]|uniref:glutathione S-transferase family protein n=1 Tax=Oceanococcus atlanticus TaxID=1317117 RepID=UPI0009FA1B2F|nr:glutathione S-transferase family protein [Oceanococcus atlanticus]
MSALNIWTYDWVPDFPRGFVRDLRLRWACEEAGFSYAVKTVPFDGRQTNHLAQQPFGQVPYLADGDLQLFESGACLLHLAEKSDKLMPTDTEGRAQTIQWMMASLNSIEMVSVAWWFLNISGEPDNNLSGWMEKRLAQLEDVLSDREWLVANRFTVADLLLADVLRVPQVRELGNRPASERYVARVTNRPAFVKAFADQIAHFKQADEARS